MGAAPVLYWQHLPVSTHWPKSTVYPGWQWGRRSGSSLRGHASYHLSQSNLGGLCQRWSCDDASHQHYFGLPGASCACRCSRGHGSHGPEVSGSSAVWMACWWPTGERKLCEVSRGIDFFLTISSKFCLSIRTYASFTFGNALYSPY